MIEKETSYRMEGIAFGMVDGMILCLGLTIGVAEAISSSTLVIITAIIGGLANALGNAIGFFMSQSTERGLQIHETKEHGVITRIHSKKEILVSTACSFLATIATLVILVSPFVLFDIVTAVTVTFLLGAILSFLLGAYVGKLSRENAYWTGLKYAVLAIVGAVISHIVGDLLQILL
ncbi:MAG: VIT1/CCC1 transporter family protein [Candidatus Bathyarchaeaceae archaeon]